jgi:hypothetical protein
VNSLFGRPELNYEHCGCHRFNPGQPNGEFSFEISFRSLLKASLKKNRPDSFCIKSYKLKNISVSVPDSNMATFGEPNSNLTSKPAKPTI